MSHPLMTLDTCHSVNFFPLLKIHNFSLDFNFSYCIFATLSLLEWSQPHNSSLSDTYFDPCLKLGASVVVVTLACKVGGSHWVKQITFYSHLPPLLTSFTFRILDFVVFRPLVSRCVPNKRFTVRLDRVFAIAFLQILQGFSNWLWRRSSPRCFSFTSS